MEQHHITHHASIRMAQRGIASQSVRFVMKHGKKIYRQGYIFHIMRDKDFPPETSASQKGRLKRMVVVTTTEPEPIVITTYRSGNALKKIKQKSKILR